MNQVFDKQNISHTVFDGNPFPFTRPYSQHSTYSFFLGRSLVSWCLTFFKLANRADAVNICKSLMGKRVFIAFEEAPSDPNAPTDFVDNSAARYRFPEDEFDVYLKNLPEEQVRSRIAEEYELSSFYEKD